MAVPGDVVAVGGDDTEDPGTLSPISEPDASIHPSPKGSVTVSMCSCEVMLIVLSASRSRLGEVGTPQVLKEVPA